MQQFKDHEIQEIVNEVSTKVYKAKKKKNEREPKEIKLSAKKPPRPQSVEKNDDVRLSNSYHNMQKQNEYNLNSIARPEEKFEFALDIFT